MKTRVLRAPLRQTLKSLELPSRRSQCRLPLPLHRSFNASAYLRGSQNAESTRFPGALEAKFTTDLKFEDPKEKEVIQCYRVMDSEGVVVDKDYERDFSDEEALKMYTNMLGTSIMDLICLDAQRQGKHTLISWSNSILT